MIDRREPVIEFLIAAFPSTVIGDLVATTAVYADALQDICACEISDAVSVLLREARTLPTIAELRQVVAELRVGERVKPFWVERVLHETSFREEEEEFDFDRAFDQ